MKVLNFICVLFSIVFNSYYIHNNWGWDGRDNGYYPSGVFDPSYNFQDVEIARVYK
jgi:hypothetical protein